MNGFFSGLELRGNNLREMMERCEVDIERLAHDRCGLTVEAVARACFFCRQGEACRQWIETADRIRVNRPPSFCPNAGHFAACATNKAARRHTERHADQGRHRDRQGC